MTGAYGTGPPEVRGREPHSRIRQCWSQPELDISEISPVGTGLAPMTFVYFGADAPECAQYLAQQNAGKTGWEAAHPATIVSGVPPGAPCVPGRSVA